MKKLITGIVTMGLVFSVSGTTTFAAKATCGFCNGTCNYNTTCQYVDADGDGICDNYSSNRGGRGIGRGTGYVDADGDGICDNQNKVTKTLKKNKKIQKVRSKGRSGNGKRNK